MTAGDNALITSAGGDVAVTIKDVRTACTTIDQDPETVKDGIETMSVTEVVARAVDETAVGVAGATV